MADIVVVAFDFGGEKVMNKISWPIYKELDPGERKTATSERFENPVTPLEADIFFPLGSANLLAITFWEVDNVIADDIHPAFVGGRVLKTGIGVDVIFRGNDSVVKVYFWDTIGQNKRIAISGLNESSTYQKTMNVNLAIKV